MQTLIIFLVNTTSRTKEQLATAAPRSGDWLHTLPISACGLHLEDNAIRVAVGLRLSSAICEAHTCSCGLTWSTCVVVQETPRHGTASCTDQ